jgi:hypothetical protein
MRLKPGSRECLCATCGVYFSSPSTFDAHRKGSGADRYCVRPGSLKKEDGSPALRLDDKGRWARA